MLLAVLNQSIQLMLGVSVLLTSSAAPMVAVTPPDAAAYSSSPSLHSPHSVYTTHSPHTAPAVVGDHQAIELAIQWFPPEEQATAARTFLCESGGNPHALGGAHERGIAQIHPINEAAVLRLGYTLDDLWDPSINGYVAYRLWAQAGWGLWSCYWRG